MKLEYAYFNNINLKYIIKRLIIFGLAYLCIVVILSFIYTGFDYFWSLASMIAIILAVIFLIAFSSIYLLYNNYKRKQFTEIKNNGNLFNGVILSAYKHSTFGQKYWVNIGDIAVECNNNRYIISDISYNKDFKLLEEKLQNYHNNVINSSLFNNTVNHEITVDIYIWENKVIADLNSINA